VRGSLLALSWLLVFWLGPASSASAQTTAATKPRSGSAVYNFSCINCHEYGIAGAPKTGDRSAWAPRLAQGETVLVSHVYEGFKGMPQRGTCTQCSREEIANAVAFMASRLR
jgi:cytochrome c5